MGNGKINTGLLIKLALIFFFKLLLLFFKCLSALLKNVRRCEIMSLIVCMGFLINAQF